MAFSCTIWQEERKMRWGAAFQMYVTPFHIGKRYSCDPGFNIFFEGEVQNQEY